MKRMLWLLAFLVYSVLLSGCWNRVEVNDLAIVTAAAIDKKDDDQIELSLQVIIPRSLSGNMGGGSGGGGGKITLVRSGHGVNIADAVSKIQAKLPRRIFWGHCKVYLFGEKLAKEGISDQIDFILRHPQPRNRAYMYVSKGKAADMLVLLPPLERSSAEVARELSDLHIGMRVTLSELRMMLRGSSEAAALPIIHKTPPKKGEKELESAPYIFGTAIFKEDKMVGQISQRATRGVMWLRDEITVTTVTIKAENVKGFVSLNPIRESTRLTPIIKDGQWKMTVKIKTEGDAFYV